MGTPVPRQPRPKRNSPITGRIPLGSGATEAPEDAGSSVRPSARPAEDSGTAVAPGGPETRRPTACSLRHGLGHRVARAFTAAAHVLESVSEERFFCGLQCRGGQETLPTSAQLAQ